MATKADMNGLDLAWMNLRKMEGTVIDNHLMPYLEKLPDAVIGTALQECYVEEWPEEIDEKLLFTNFFIPWLLFNWMPGDSFHIKKFDPGVTLAQNYLKANASKLTSDEIRFINAMNTTHYSFYTILNVESEKSLVVKDIMLGETHTIKEQQGTRQLKRGDIVFSRILTLDQQSIFIGMAPFVVPSRHNIDLINFRKWLIGVNNHQGLTATTLREEFDIDLHDYFFEIIINSFNQPAPTFVNTDGELIQLTKSEFTLTMSPEEAMQRLLPLTLEKDAQEFLAAAELNEAGIKQIKFSWLKKGNKKHQGWENTIMGHVTIEDGKIVLEANSAKRAKLGKKLLEKYLGNTVHFQQTTIESLVSKGKSPANNQANNLTEDDLLERPEVQKQIKAMIKAHWENWFDNPIPVLDNKTPREAAKTAAGKELLEALLLDYERHDADGNRNNFLKADIKYLRAKLGLD